MKKSKNKGITLVALIVTIIILLILAGVTIALLSGEDGILSRTEKAATSYQTERIKEVVNLKLANLNAGKWIDEGRKAILKDLNELDDESSSNFDAEISLKNQVGDSDTSAILVYDQHEVEVDSSLNITKVDGEKQEGTSGGNSGNAGSGESGSTSGGNTGSIDSAEYAKMQETIAQMQEKINQLEAQSATKSEVNTLEEKYAIKTEVESELANTNSKIDSAQNQIDNMLTTLDVDTRTTLFEGTAATKATSYTLNNNYKISDFKYIIVYGAGIRAGNLVDRYSTMLNTTEVIAGNQYALTISTSSYWGLSFYFQNASTFYIPNIANDNYYTGACIYKIEGIK